MLFALSHRQLVLGLMSAPHPTCAWKWETAASELLPAPCCCGNPAIVSQLPGLLHLVPGAASLLSRPGFLTLKDQHRMFLVFSALLYCALTAPSPESTQLPKGARTPHFYPVPNTCVPSHLLPNLKMTASYQQAYKTKPDFRISE